MIEEARDSAAHLADRKQQEAIAAAEQILAKAREASAIEHERTMRILKRELGRLVVETTAKVTGKVLTPDDQRRLQEEAARQLSPDENQKGNPKLAREMLRASFTDGQLDRGRIASLVDSILARKPRNYLEILNNYKRLLRLEAEKRHARIETASEVDSAITSQALPNLTKNYGSDLTTEFAVNPELLGGMRIRVGSDVWDGTVRNRLENLQQQL